MSYTPQIIPAIPSDIAAARHAAIVAKFATINAAMSQFSCAKKSDAVAHAAIALSKSGSGACGYASAVSAISAAAAAMGRKGGKSKSAAKKSAVRENGKKGGRPKTTFSAVLCGSCKWRDLAGHCTNPKLHEKFVGPVPPGLEDQDDQLEYCYNEGGGFWVGPLFGCVHGARE